MAAFLSLTLPARRRGLPAPWTFIAVICACITWAALPPCASAQIYEKLIGFTQARLGDPANTLNLGNRPSGGLMQGKDGIYYGTTEFGGASNNGTIFKIEMGGSLTTLVEFTGNGLTNRGSAPVGGLVEGADGSLYGTTFSGGAGNLGTIFRMTPGGVLTTLVDFTGNGATQKGARPFCRMLLGNDGNFYGATENGGGVDSGTVFRMTPTGELTTVVEFSGGMYSNAGRYPSSPLVQDSDGNLYGTTQHGGRNGSGTLYRVTSQSVLTTIADFPVNGPGAFGSYPYGALALAGDGNLYGTTLAGGPADRGTIFKVTPSGVLTTVVAFANEDTSRGNTPRSGLRGSSDGKLYGTTSGGGAFGLGTLFSVTLQGALQTLADFTGKSGAVRGKEPGACLIQGSDGSLYGTTNTGGVWDKGTVFRMTPEGQFSTLIEFTGNGSSMTGRAPAGALFQTASGNIVGTTCLGGASNCGTLFQVGQSGECLTLIEFTGNGPLNRGRSPDTQLIAGRDGTIIGTTSAGGAVDGGTIFEYSALHGLTSLIEFTGSTGACKGSTPLGLLRAKDEIIYGTALGGGSYGFGTVFKLTALGELVNLVEFTGDSGANRGCYPQGGLAEASNGELYGTTSGGGHYRNGTIFKIKTDGTLVTLVDFYNQPGGPRGRIPYGRLVATADGGFYGTTRQGGAYDQGTIFKISSAEAFSTLIDFAGNSAPKGRLPGAGLIQGFDGNFYGTTEAGGTGDFGTVYRMNSAGALTTVHEFTVGEDGHPVAELNRGMDGNLYGTSKGPDGAIFRLVSPGPPIVNALRVTQGSAQSIVEAKVNPRGAATDVWLEYGIDGAGFSQAIPVSLNLTGFQTALVGVTLRGLIPGAVYSYRFRAVSPAGTSTSIVEIFSTLAPPIVATSPATEVTAGSAIMQGTVNPRSFEATVSFAWGSDGESFPNSAVSAPAFIKGNALTPVNAAVAGLLKGTTYYYRIVASNAGGTTVSGTRSFRTPIECVATLGGVIATSTTSAKVSGFVNARDSSTQVLIEYGTDEASFPNSVVATPSFVTGSDDTPVGATLNNLLQGKTYYYRLKGTSAGGAGFSGVGSFALNVLSGFAQIAPGVLPDAQGFVVVNLSPAGIGAKWRFVGEQQWREPGVPLGGLTTGNRQIEFRPVPGYFQPLREPITISSGTAATLVEREYFTNGDAATAAISVTLLPAALTGTGWRLLGDDAAPWRAGGETIGGLPPGVYLVELLPVAGYAAPPSISVTVADGQTATASATYYRADAPVGAQTAVIGFDALTAEGPNPYRYVGQLRSDSGAGTGFVVRKRVVATAAHVVFDDSTLTAATGLQWLFQRERNTYEPVPQEPRGSYILAGYAAQRTNDISPGVSSAAAQNLDVAAVWFYEEEAGREGFGGFLASDAVDNEWLLSPRLKTLVGYPLDGIAAANQGRVHATAPANVAFARATQQVYLTADVTSRGGNSGGPLSVQFDDGNWYPAAVYLGGTTQTRVRVIDGDVVTLFDSAELSGTTGQNNTNGGLPLANSAAAAPRSGTLTVTLQPAGACSGGAGWRIGSGGFRASGQAISFLSPGNYAVSFNPVAGYLTPAPRRVSVAAGAGNSIVATYTLLVPPVIRSTGIVRAIRGRPFGLTIESDSAPTLFSVSGLAGTGLTLADAGAGILSGTPTNNGSYELIVVAQNSAGASAPVKIVFIVSDSGQLTVQTDATRGTVGVSPSRPGSIFPQGQSVVLTAKARSSAFLFAGWQFDGLTGTDHPNLASASTTFIMTESVVAIARFIPNPYLSLSGSYAGRITPATGVALTNSGRLGLTLDKLGGFTGTLLLGAKTYRLKGRFAADGVALVKIKRIGTSDLTLDLVLDPMAGGTERVTGTLMVDGVALPLVLEHAYFVAKTRPAPQAGSYTLLLPHPAPISGILLPEGDGYAAVTVTAAGVVRFAGKLGDGSPLSVSGAMSKAGACPIHLLLYGSKGVLTGELAFGAAAPITGFAGDLDWIKPPLSGATVTYPAGFTTRTSGTGLRFDKAAALKFSTANVSFAGGGLPVPPLGTMSVDDRKRFTRISGPPVTLQYLGATGLFKGKLGEPGVAPRTFFGARQGVDGSGWFTGAQLSTGGLQTGRVELHGN